MDYLDIGSFLPDWPEWLELPDLPDLPPAIQSAWQVCWEQLQLVDGLYLAVAGGIVLLCILVTTALTRWKVRQSQNTQTKSHEKHKQRGTKNIRNEETEKSKNNKWKKPDLKTPIQESERKASWLTYFTEKFSFLKKGKNIKEGESSKNIHIKSNVAESKSEEKNMGWFSDSKEEPVKQTKSKSDAKETKTDEKKTGWFSSSKEEPEKQMKSKSDAKEIKTEEKKKGWFSFSKEANSNPVEFKADVPESRDSFMRPINLNIDREAQPREVSKKKTEKELQLMRKMCGEFREVVKLDNKEDREEKQKEMDKVRSARSYFKTVDKYRSESVSANPRIRFKTDEDLADSYSRGNQKRLSQFTPGKINSRLTSLFGGDQQPDLIPQKPPKKKLITLDQVMKKGSPKADEEGNRKRMELEELKQSRKQWEPPMAENVPPASHVREKIVSLQSQTTPVKQRWNPTEFAEKEVFHKTLQMPNKLNIDKVFPNTLKDEEVNEEIEKELDELRLSRPKRFAKIGSKERSSSAHVLQRVKLEDSSWVVEKSENRLAEEKRKAEEEIELIRLARLETLETLETMELERPSSRIEDQTRFEAMKELDEVRRARTVTMQDDIRSEVIKVVENQITQESKNEISDKDADENLISVNENVTFEENNVFIEDNIVPVEENNVLVEENSVFVEDENIPVEENNVPFEENNVLFEETVVSIEEKHVQIEEKHVHFKENDIQVSEEAGNNDAKPVIIQDGENEDCDENSVSVEDENIPVEENNVPFEENNVFIEEIIVPEEENNGLVEENSVSVEDENIPVEENDIPFEETIVSIEEKIVQIEEKHVHFRENDIQVSEEAGNIDAKLVPVQDEENEVRVDKVVVECHEDYDENSRLKLDQVNLKAKELAILALELEKEKTEDQETDGEALEHHDTEDQLQERLRELTEMTDCRSLDIAMAIAAEGLQGNTMRDLESYDVDEFDEEFEEKKKMIEDELRQIEEEYKAVQEQDNTKLSQENDLNNAEGESGNEDVSLTETYEDLTERLLKVAQTIQESARHLGDEEIDLSPRIDRIQLLRDECQVANQSIPVKENNEKTVTAKEEDKHKQECIKFDELENGVSIISENVVENEPTQKTNQDFLANENRFSSINAVPKIKFLTDQEMFQSNQKRNTIDLAQFQRAKINHKFKNIFEEVKESTEEIQLRRHPKKKLITLDQVLIKSPSQNINHEKEIELEIVKTLRKNWVPPEDSVVETSKPRLEPNRLKIDHVYGNDTKGGTEKLKIERQNELEEVRQSAPLGTRWRSEDTEVVQEEKRPRPRSALKVKLSDDFWLKEKPDTKIDEEKQRVFHEIESVKQARQKFQEEPERRQENDTRLNTLQELENLRTKQKQMDSSVKKIKRDLEEINRNVAEKEVNEGPSVDTVHNNTTEKWKQERENIKESFSAKLELDQEIKPVVTNKTKWIEEVVQKENPNIEDEIDIHSVEPEVIKTEDSTTVEDKIKSKLKEIKSLDVFKQKDKSSKSSKKNETERGRTRELKTTEAKEGTSLRSKSISSLKNAGQKLKNLTNEKLKMVMKTKAVEGDHDDINNTNE